MKIIYSISALFLLSTYAYTQVGINNTVPQATLDITSKTTDGSRPEGLIAPRLTGDQIKAADARYTASQTGTIIYATAAVGTVTTKTVNITSAGYYFFDGSVWQKVITASTASDNIYTADGTLTNNRTVSQGNNTLAFNTTATTGTSHFTVDGSTFNVNAANNNIGIGTNTPDTSSALDISSTNKGLLLPRITLSSENDATTVTNPATGLSVYHIGNSTLQAGLYTNVGTSALPKWVNGPIISKTEGSKVYKTLYRGRNVSPFDKPDLMVPDMNLKFRFADVSGVMRLQVALINPPASDITVRLLGHWQGDVAANHNSYANTIVFTPANYSVWTFFGGNWSGEYGYYYLVYTDEQRTGNNNPFLHAMNLYGIDSFGFYGTAIDKELYSLSAEVF